MSKINGGTDVTKVSPSHQELTHDQHEKSAVARVLRLIVGLDFSSVSTSLYRGLHCNESLHSGM
ncbi:hypothetical protein RvY_06338 [Ramazzottius varieornatus]|uniref:Uncharacterized protein n=1 Tax=Ramazzottius varieornatus TaxID=947166 RepID=A0A1D1UY56_RAMVA|nr:hypothetical protein RvY_06338 [Ramazzottius varieornatus]